MAPKIRVDMDQIEIRGLRVHGFHGVFEEERRYGQTFTIDLWLDVDLSLAGETDQLGDTVDYGALTQQLAAAVRETRFTLLEALARHLAGLCLADPVVDGVRLRVAKTDAPMSEDLDAVAVTISRTRAR